jgi:hypothetical protein
VCGVFDGVGYLAFEAVSIVEGRTAGFLGDDFHGRLLRTGGVGRQLVGRGHAGAAIQAPAGIQTGSFRHTRGRDRIDGNAVRSKLVCCLSKHAREIDDGTAARASTGETADGERAGEPEDVLAAGDGREVVL